MRYAWKKPFPTGNLEPPCGGARIRLRIVTLIALNEILESSRREAVGSGQSGRGHVCLRLAGASWTLRAVAALLAAARAACLS